MKLDTLIKSVEPDQPSADFTRKVMNALPQKKTIPPIISQKTGWAIAGGIAACVAVILLNNTAPINSHGRMSQVFTLLHTDYFLLIPIIVAICLVMWLDYFFQSQTTK
ncbi:hypothetical protein [Chitinophaga sancti]|uniref:hypothetical protein n=1 Tax=Chitinophaga sancti TaxID=1004 RepID=UPI003F7A8AC3